MVKARGVAQVGNKQGKVGHKKQPCQHKVGLRQNAEGHRPQQHGAACDNAEPQADNESYTYQPPDHGPLVCWGHLC